MRRKKDKSNGITALYERLSRDDDNAGESNSIVHQKQKESDTPKAAVIRCSCPGHRLPMLCGRSMREYL